MLQENELRGLLAGMKQHPDVGDTRKSEKSRFCD
jgi:hypothetical protein